jgi:hypothetical protein
VPPTVLIPLIFQRRHFVFQLVRESAFQERRDRLLHHLSHRDHAAPGQRHLVRGPEQLPDPDRASSLLKCILNDCVELYSSGSL